MLNKYSIFSKIAALLDNPFGGFFSSRKKYAVLTYHNVCDHSIPENRVAFRHSAFVNLDEFDRQMRYVAENCAVIPLQEMVERIKEGKRADRFYVSITFDDGYEDNYRLALPILKRYALTATWFITSGFVDDRKYWPWWDLIADVSANTDGPFSLTLDGENREFLLGNEAERRRFQVFLGEYVKNSPPEAVEEILNQLYALNGSKGRENYFADWSAVQDATQQGVLSAGGHTVTHVNLAQCADHGSSEIVEGKKAIERAINQPITLFAYPFGNRASFDKSVVQAVRDAGFMAAFTLLSGYNKRNSDPYTLKRIIITGFDDFSMFLMRLRFAHLVYSLESLSWFLSRFRKMLKGRR